MGKATKIVLYDFSGETSLSDDFRDKLGSRAQTFEVVEAEKDYSGEISSEDIQGADILISRVFDDYSRELFEDSGLEYIGVMATDKSHYPLEFLKSQEIKIQNVPDYARESVAELTITMMLHLSLNNYRTTRFVEEGNWDIGPFTGSELKGKELGIVGLGSIGSRVAEIAEVLGMSISYFSRSEKNFARARGWEYSDLEKLVKNSDVISVHCSLNEETENLLDEELLEKVQESAIILNASREEIQDVDKTIELCRKEKIQAWFDALEDRENREKLLATENAILTSHSGCATEEAKERLKQKTLEKLDNFLNH
jgi:D-3-phosphoglycerate dehydrogenase